MCACRARQRSLCAHAVLDSGFCVLMQCQTAGVARQSALVPRAFMVQELALRQAEEADRAWGASDASALTDAVQNTRVCNHSSRGPLGDQLCCTEDKGSSHLLCKPTLRPYFLMQFKLVPQGLGCYKLRCHPHPVVRVRIGNLAVRIVLRTYVKLSTPHHSKPK